MSYLGESSDFRRQNKFSPSAINRVEQNYQREADINRFNKQARNFDRFQAATGSRGNISNLGDITNTVPKIGGKYMLAVREPQLTARQPTFREAGNDFMRGLGRFTSAVGDRMGAFPVPIPGAAFLANAFGGVRDGINNFFNQSKSADPVMPNVNYGAGNDRGIEPMMNMQSEQFKALNATQQDLYNMLIKQGSSHALAYAQALAQKVPAYRAMGGIVNLS
tara:strand:+ start:1010 stop:1672 length:663 start_codon:yes stop_codon:yes gene_type:complete